MMSETRSLYRSRIERALAFCVEFAALQQRDGSSEVVQWFACDRLWLLTLPRLPSQGARTVRRRELTHRSRRTVRSVSSLERSVRSGRGRRVSRSWRVRTSPVWTPDRRLWYGRTISTVGSGAAVEPVRVRSSRSRLWNGGNAVGTLALLGPVSSDFWPSISLATWLLLVVVVLLLRGLLLMLVGLLLPVARLVLLHVGR